MIDIENPDGRDAPLAVTSPASTELRVQLDPVFAEKFRGACESLEMDVEVGIAFAMKNLIGLAEAIGRTDSGG